MNMNHRLPIRRLLACSIALIACCCASASAQTAAPPPPPAARALPSPTTAPATAPAANHSGHVTTAPGGKLLINFRDASIDSVLDELSAVAGFIVIKIDKPEGRVTLVSKQPVTPDD